MLVGFFTGMVLGLQLYFVLVKFGSVGVLGTAISLTLIREMGPVLTAIMSIVFGLLIVTTCCFQGFFTHMRTDSFGAKSVSLSTTSAVVISCVMVLISDYVFTSFII